MTMEHTPTPWINDNSDTRYDERRILGFHGELIANVMTEKMKDANAAFIVTACNAHDELVSALTNLLFHAEEFTELPTNASNAIAMARSTLKSAGVSL